MNFSFLADEAATFWFPPPASTFAKQVDNLYTAILWISILFFIPIVVAMIYFVVKFRDRPGYKGDRHALHNTPLEITWTVIPTFVAVWIFWEGMVGFLAMAVPPDNTLNIGVRASKWSWAFTYKENGGVSDRLYVPVDTNVKLVLTSKDVLHSMYIPAFRTKRDVVPGRYHYMWFNATQEGVYDVFCAEYCGDNHSNMITKVEVLSKDAYAAKLAELVKEPTDIVERGKWLYEKRGCKGCHKAGDEGQQGPGPSYNGSWNKMIKLSTGSDVKFDENYVRDSILNPTAAYRDGFANTSQMPSFKGQLTDEQIEAITAFIQSLENHP